MRYFYLVDSKFNRSIVPRQGFDYFLVMPALIVEKCALAVDEEDRAQAFWERLEQDLAGLIALYQIKDIMLKGHHAVGREQAIIECLGENYQFYLFPRVEAEPEGFEGVISASILAEGISDLGLSAEVAGRLLSVMAHL